MVNQSKKKFLIEPPKNLTDHTSKARIIFDSAYDIDWSI